MVSETTIVLAFVFAFGLSIGSFLNVLIYRLPRGRGLAGRSACPHCQATLSWFDLIPVLSFLALRARCRRCRAPIAWRYPLIELLTGIIALAVVGRFGLTPTAGLYFAFAAALIAVTFIDLDWKIIPDVITLPGALIGLVAVLAVHLASRSGLSSAELVVTPWRALAGAIGGPLGLWLVAVAYHRFTGIEGLGFGDVKLAALLGAFLGAVGVFITIFLAAAAGSVVGLVLIASGRGTSRTALPFGSFLAPAGVLVLLYGPRLLSWYYDRLMGMAG
jgi:leader peptidase (prepilin peptidase)/N-methyltransferase